MMTEHENIPSPFDLVSLTVVGELRDPAPGRVSRRWSFTVKPIRWTPRERARREAIWARWA